MTACNPSEIHHSAAALRSSHEGRAVARELKDWKKK
jgi:hypothetical protein